MTLLLSGVNMATQLVNVISVERPQRHIRKRVRRIVEGYAATAEG